MTMKIAELKRKQDQLDAKLAKLVKRVDEFEKQYEDHVRFYHPEK